MILAGRRVRSPWRRVLLLLAFAWACTSGLGAARAADAMAPIYEADPDWAQATTLDPSALAAGSHAGSSGISLLVHEEVIRLAGDGQRWVHGAERVLNSTGAQTAAQRTFEYDPQYERLVIHRVGVWRDGQWGSRLDPARVEVLHRELDLDVQIYTGLRAALVMLDDVRPGDVIEYSYSIVGRNPILGPSPDAHVNLALPEPVQALRVDVLWPSGVPYSVSRHGGAPEPSATTEKDEVRFRWTRQQAASARVPPNTPYDVSPQPWAQISAYSTWDDVVAWAAPLFEDAIATPADPETVARLVASGASSRERVMAALRFVQEEVRYLALEFGVNSHRPSAPAQVLRRRFGDCKDKSVLLVSLLRAMGIDAWPALVRADAPGWLASVAPSPQVFDHAIVVAELEGERVWMDPSLVAQGGDWQHLAAPDYQHALILRAGTSELSTIETPDPKLPTIETHMAYTIAGVESGASEVELSTRFRGRSADAVRAEFAAWNRERFASEMLANLKDVHPDAEAMGPLAVDDFRSLNEVEVRGRYRVEGFWRDRGAGRFEARVFPLYLGGLLPLPDPERRLPLALERGQWIAQTTDVKLPPGFAIDAESVAVERPEFRFSFASSKAKQGWTLTHDLRLDADRVDAAALTEYTEAVRAVDRALPFDLFVVDVAAPARPWLWPVVWVGVLAFTLGLLGVPAPHRSAQAWLWIGLVFAGWRSFVLLSELNIWADGRGGADRDDLVLRILLVAFATGAAVRGLSAVFRSPRPRTEEPSRRWLPLAVFAALAGELALGFRGNTGPGPAPAQIERDS